MADTIISPNMNLPVPTVSMDSGPDWADNLNACLSAIDSHDHTAGQGVQIPPSGLNINSNLPMGNNSLANTKSIIFNPQASLATLDAIYVIGVDLYYNDGSGNVVRITQGGAVTGATGTITGLPSGTAGVSYQSVGGTYVFQSATSTAANIDVRSIILRNNVASSFGLTLNPPAAMGSDIAQTLPTLPGATGIMRMDTSGNMSANLVVDASTIVISSNILQVPTSGITATQLAADSVITSKILNSNVTSAKIQTNVNLPGNSSSAGGKNLVVEANASGSNLNVVWCRVNTTGTIVNGQGVSSVTQSGTSNSIYTFNFSNSFSSSPTVYALGEATAGNMTFVQLVNGSVSASSVQIQIYVNSVIGGSAVFNPATAVIDFMAVGPV